MALNITLPFRVTVICRKLPTAKARKSWKIINQKSKLTKSESQTSFNKSEWSMVVVQKEEVIGIAWIVSIMTMMRISFRQIKCFNKEKKNWHLKFRACCRRGGVCVDQKRHSRFVAEIIPPEASTHRDHFFSQAWKNRRSRRGSPLKKQGLL